MSRGIDYAPIGSNINRDAETGIRYGVIPVGRLGEFAHESFESEYDACCPHCGDDLPDDIEFTVANRPAGLARPFGLWAICPACGEAIHEDDSTPDEPSRQVCKKDGIDASLDSSGDSWWLKSPYFTRAAFCSPCAPGACYLTSPTDDGERAYCPGPEWFDDDNPAPYPIYSVATGELVAAKAA